MNNQQAESCANSMSSFLRCSRSCVYLHCDVRSGISDYSKVVQPTRLFSSLVIFSLLFCENQSTVCVFLFSLFCRPSLP